VVIDLGDATLLPGLIDAHVHLTSELQENFAQTFVDRVLQAPPEQALRAHVYARRTLEGGITTVRDLGSDDREDYALQRGIELGFAEGPRMQSAEWPI